MGIINRKKVKELTNLQISEEFYKELELETEKLLKKAESRARDNYRRTLLKRDL